MSELFIEKAFWFFAALIISLIAVIYKLFNGSLKKDQEILKSIIKAELSVYLDDKLTTVKKSISLEFEEMRNKMEKDHSHLLANVKNINLSMEHGLYQKFVEIERIGEKYLDKLENRGDR